MFSDDIDWGNVFWFVLVFGAIGNWLFGPRGVIFVLGFVALLLAYHMLLDIYEWLEKKVNSRRQANR